MSEISHELIHWTMTAFERGEDTAGMAKLWFEHTEADFERALHIGLARRKAERDADELAEAVGRLADELGVNV